MGYILLLLPRAIAWFFFWVSLFRSLPVQLYHCFALHGIQIELILFHSSPIHNLRPSKHVRMYITEIWFSSILEECPTILNTLCHCFIVFEFSIVGIQAWGSSLFQKRGQFMYYWYTTSWESRLKNVVIFVRIRFERRIPSSTWFEATVFEFLIVIVGSIEFQFEMESDVYTTIYFHYMQQLWYSMALSHG